MQEAGQAARRSDRPKSDGELGDEVRKDVGYRDVPHFKMSI